MTRTALAAGLSAVALVGLPLTMAAPVAAQPLGAWDDPDPTSSPTPDETEAPATVNVPLADQPSTDPEVIDALETDIPPAAEDVGEVAVVVEHTGNDLARPLDDRALDLTRDSAPAAEEPAAPTAEVPQGPAAGGGDGADNGPDAQATGNGDSAGNTDSAGNDDSSSRADGSVPEAAAEGTDSAGTAQTDGVATASAAGSVSSSAASSSTASLVKTGAASTGLVQAGVALLAGGILLVGTGRHRRTRTELG